MARMTEAEIEEFGTRLYLGAFAVGAIINDTDNALDAVQRLIENGQSDMLDETYTAGQAFAKGLQVLAMRLNRRALGDAQDQLEQGAAKAD
jgi:hypothetical protein